MRILLAQEDPDIREKLSFAIEATFPAAQVHRAEDIEALDTALSDPAQSWDLMIIDLPSAKPKTLTDLLIGHQNIGALFLEPQNAEPGWNVWGTIPRKSIIDSTREQIQKLIDLGKLQAENAEGKKYTRIKTQILLSVSPLKGDLFIKLGEGHYVKLFKEGDQFEKDDLEKYTLKKGIEYLHIRTDQTQEFISKYQQELNQLIGSANSIQKVAEISESVYDTIQSLGKNLGFTKDVQILAKTQMRITVQSMGKSPKLSEILDRLESFKGQYISAHSTLTAYLSCAIASQLEWGSETTFHKLTLAAMLHDITLTNHKLAACETLEEVEAGAFTEEERVAFQKHMTEAAEVARRFTEVPADVDTIIAQHHEQPDGSGFPRKLTSNYMSPLAAVFIVAHDLAKFSLAAGPNAQVDAEQFLLQARADYQTNQFKKIISAIEKLYPGLGS